MVWQQMYHQIIIITGDSIAAGLIWYGNISYEYFNQDTLNCWIDKYKIQIFLWRSQDIPLPQSLKSCVINCSTKNLDISHFHMDQRNYTPWVKKHPNEYWNCKDELVISKIVRKIRQALLLKTKCRLDL